jgi:hypothetical protein
MNDAHLPVGLKIFVGMACGGGAAFILWRTVVSLRSGSIWLRGQNIIRRDEPGWFWAYMATYLFMVGAMLYGVGVVVVG